MGRFVLWFALPWTRPLIPNCVEIDTRIPNDSAGFNVWACPEKVGASQLQMRTSARRRPMGRRPPRVTMGVRAYTPSCARVAPVWSTKSGRAQRLSDRASARS